MKDNLIPIYEDKQIIEFADKQLSVFWTAEEIKVEKDIQDVLTNFTESEKHGVLTVLKLFSLYETHIGDEFWSGRFKQMFNTADMHRMASVFAMFELAVHAPFYNKINELLYVNTPEFYKSYEHDAVLKQRIDFIGEHLNNKNDIISLGTFSMIEGVVLYSSFAYLKHYQSVGKNKLLNVIRGINFSVRDENLHAEASAYSFKKKMQDKTPEQKQAYQIVLSEIANTIYQHEIAINKKLFEKGKVEGITEVQLDHFVQSRINLCMKNLGFDPLFDVKYNPVADWFYKGINDYQFVDFFSGQGREYNRNWAENEFVWKTK